VRSGAHVDPLTRQFAAFRSTGRIKLVRKLLNEVTYLPGKIPSLGVSKLVQFRWGNLFSVRF